MLQMTPVSESLQFPMVEVRDFGPWSLGLSSDCWCWVFCILVDWFEVADDSFSICSVYAEG
jgi:hypothetical protein